MLRPIKRRRDGTYVLRLDEDTLDLVRALAAQLDPLLDDPSADSGLRRLFPPAHEEDVLAEAAWQIEQGARLRDSRRAALGALDQRAEEPMDEERMVAWMQGVNALRLVLGERLGIEGNDDGEADVAEAEAVLEASDDPAAVEEASRRLAAWQLYDLLSALVAYAVRALEAGED